jgi:uncharacterized membrane protein YozB (DUF420 family)
MKEAPLVSAEFGRSAGGRWLFVVAAIVVTIIVLLGFAPSYVMRLQHHDRNLIWLVHLHGLLTALWIALFLIQALLIARRRADLHRRFGAAGAGLAILVFCTGAATLVHAAQRRGPGLNAARGVRYLEMLVAFDGFGLLAFAGLVAVALWLRRRPEWHKRLMLLATLSLLGPAFGRITAYVNHMHGDNDVGVLLLCVGCVVICAVVDSVRHRRLHQAFVGGGGLVLTMYLTTYVAKTLL